MWVECEVFQGFNGFWEFVEVEGNKEKGLEAKLGLYDENRDLGMVWSEKIVGKHLCGLWLRCEVERW